VEATTYTGNVQWRGDEMKLLTELWQLHTERGERPYAENYRDCSHAKRRCSGI